MFPFQKKKTDEKDMKDEKSPTKKKNPFADKGFGGKSFGKKPMFPPKPMGSPRSF